MSRALRKAQRKELEKKQGLPDPANETDGETEEEILSTSQAPNLFDLLNDDEQAAVSKKDNDSVATGSDAETGEDGGDIIATPVISQKPRKKRKGKSKGKKNQNDRTTKTVAEHDFDEVLAEHTAALEYIQLEAPEQSDYNLAEILAIDVKMLDPNIEMRRLFGSKVVASERAERAQTARRAVHRGMQIDGPRGRKSVLVPMEDNFPLTIKGGLEMDMIQDVDGIRTFRFVHTKAYQNIQFMFIECVQSGDPQTMMNLLSRHPFHVDTLLQVSEILRHQGDNEQSAEMLNRALFAFDRAFHPLFNLATGLVRLPFEVPENRPFYLAIYRYIQALGRRGCWATAFEFTKLLYALEPEEDPYAALQCIDFYAIKARRWDYVAKLNECPWHRVLDVNYPKPNFEYAAAVASFLNKKDDAQQLLRDAVTVFPYFVGSLFTELKTPGPIQFDLEPESNFAAMLRDLYIFRAKDIYNTPELLKFLRDTTLPMEVKESDIVQCPDELPLNICRHIYLLDERSLLHFLPKEITSASHLSFDPLPPPDSLPSYLEAYTVSSGSGPGQVSATMIPQFIQDLLRRVMPRAEANGGVLDGDELAAMMLQLEMQDNDAGQEGQNPPAEDNEFADPNGYGPNRGVDEPEQEGNAGRR